MFDTMTFTKIVGGFCGALLVFLLGKWAAELVYHSGGHGYGHEQAYVIDTGDDADADTEEEAGPTFAELFVNADPGKGERVFNKCKACHKLEEGANITGPYLHGVVGREVASVAGFGYSGSLAPVADVWTPRNLDAFLENPSGYAPGTTMGFAGLSKAEDRANLIAFLDQTDGDTYEIEMPTEEVTQETAEESAVDAVTEEAAQEEIDESDAAEELTAEQPAVSEVEPTPEAAAEAEEATETPADEAAEAGDAAEEDAAAEDPVTEPADIETPAEEEAAKEDEAAAPAASGFAAMVAAADPADGEKVFRKCKACHVAAEEKNRVGPHMVGIVGREVAAVDGFRYSDALEEYGGEWTYDRLNAYLEDPKGVVPGTKMSFAGLRKEEDRAGVIAYLESVSN